MDLDLVERFTLLSTLPEKGDMVTIKVLRRLREALAPSEKEIEQYDLRSKDWQIQSGQGVCDVDITETQRGIIVDALKDADSKKQLTVQHISLWEKFCENGKE